MFVWPHKGIPDSKTSDRTKSPKIMWRPITDFNSKRILQDFITSLQNTNSSEAERILFLAMFLTAFYGFFRIGEFAAKSAGFCTVILYDSIRVGSLTSAGKIHSLIMNEDNHHSFQTQNAQSPLWHYNHRRRLLALLSQLSHWSGLPRSRQRVRVL